MESALPKSQLVAMASNDWSVSSSIAESLRLVFSQQKQQVFVYTCLLTTWGETVGNYEKIVIFTIIIVLHVISIFYDCFLGSNVKECRLQMMLISTKERNEYEKNDKYTNYP